MSDEFVLEPIDRAVQEDLERLLEEMYLSTPLSKRAKRLGLQLLKSWLFVAPRDFALEAMAPSEMESLPFKEMARVYWTEIDHTIAWVRAQVYSIVSSRIRQAAAATDGVARAMALRQLIELTVWACYYQQVQTLAYNTLV